MVKGDFHGTFDERTYVDYVKNVGKGNVRKKLEEYMRGFNAQYSDDLDGINLELLEVQIVKLQNRKARIEVELQAKMAIVEEAKEKVEAKAEKELAKEKERLETLKKCIGCSRPIAEGEKKSEFPGGFVCHGCQLGMTGKQYKEWSKKNGSKS